MKRAGTDVAEVPAQPSAPTVEDVSAAEEASEADEALAVEQESRAEVEAGRADRRPGGRGARAAEAPALAETPALTERERRSSPSSSGGGSTPAPRSRRSGTRSSCPRRATTSCSTALLDNPAALAHDPVLVGRLRRLRAGRPHPPLRLAPGERSRAFGLRPAVIGGGLSRRSAGGHVALGHAICLCGAAAPCACPG